MPTPLQDYLFDLRGFLLLEGVVAPQQINTINRAIDAIPKVKPGQWSGNVHYQDQPPEVGINYQNILEGGPAFEELIDHPGWIDLVNRYVGGDDGLFIDEAFVNLRGPGQAINLHSGGHKRRVRTQFRFHNNQFRCGQVNVLLALTDIGPGDGATMVIPGSHKSNLPHPKFVEQYAGKQDKSVKDVDGAIEVQLRAGDAILFVDAIAHGSAERVNAGERRILVYRYGPHWGNTRFGYVPSRELVERLKPARRAIVQPIPPLLPPNR